MYITINNIIGEKRIDLNYPIRGKEAAVVSVFSDRVPGKETFEITATERRKDAAGRDVYG